MAAREKRIERMNTMPNIKIPESNAQAQQNSSSSSSSSTLEDHKRMVHRFKTLATLPVIEMEEDGDSEDNHPKKTENVKAHHRTLAKQPVIELDELKSEQSQSET